MAENIDAKSERKLTCAFKIDMRNLPTFHQSTFRGWKIGALMGSFYAMKKMYEFKIHMGFMCHGNKEWRKNWKEIDLSVQNWHEGFHEFWPVHSKISKICTLMGCFWPNYMVLELKNVQRSYIWWHWRLMQNWKDR